jgi:hypothetical protein
VYVPIENWAFTSPAAAMKNCTKFLSSILKPENESDATMFWKKWNIGSYIGSIFGEGSEEWDRRWPTPGRYVEAYMWGIRVNSVKQFGRDRVLSSTGKYVIAEVYFSGDVPGR